MLPYLIAGAIGFVVGKLFEEDEAPKYADGGNIDYSDFRTSVIGLMNDNKVLILQRGSTANWMPNKWSIVGGVIEEGEVPIESMIRECEEEIGLKPSNVSYDHKIMTTDSGEIYYFNGTLKSKNVKLDYENSAYKFISKDEIDNYDFVPYVKEFVLQIFSRNEKKNLYKSGGSVLLAPNGKPSKLTPEQYKLVRTPEFKKWFGDWENDPANASKVVDSNGEPLPVYHGTSAEPFDIFYEGSYFTDDYMNADGYASGEMIYEVFLNMKKPLIINARGRKWNELKNKYGSSTQEIVSKLDDEKYDGIFFNNINDNWFDDEGEPQNVYYTINPFQIKLADGTNTTFDGRNPDIRFEEGGSINDPMQNMKNFDFSLLFSNDESSTPTKDESDYNSEKIASIQSEIDSQIVNIENQLKDWASRVYKSNKNIIYTDNNDIYGDALTIDSINESKRSKKVQTLSNEIESLMKAKEMLSKYNIHREGDITANILKDFSKEDYIKKGKKMSLREQMIIDDAYDKIIKLLKANDNNSQFRTGGNISETLLAPNGKQSNLTPEQYKLVRSPEFKAWFGDWENDPENSSKVVDFNGEPLVVYHGTNAEINVFDIQKIHASGESVFKFTTSYEMAIGYGNNVYSVFLSIKKNEIGHWSSPKKGLSKFYANTTFDKARLDLVYESRKADESQGGVIYGLISNDLKNKGDVYFVHYSNQIKLADGTNTTFDANNPDIRFDDGGSVSNYREFYDNLQIEDGSKYIGQKFANVFPFIGKKTSPAQIRISVKEYNNLLGRLENDNYTTKGMKTADLNRFEKRKKYIDKKKYLSRFYLDPSGTIIGFDNSDND
jgi:8-oxo-dGTP pyrophosphatase MutT (NUDIX family)